MRLYNKITDLFNPTTNQAGGFKFENPKSADSLSVRFGGRPKASEAWKNFGSQRQVNPQSGLPGRRPNFTGSDQAQSAMAQVQAQAPMGGSSQSAMAQAPAPMGGGSQPPMNPTMAQGPEAAPAIPSQWMKPDGTFFTPDEVAGNIASTLQQGSAGGDIGKIAGDNIVGGQKTTEQLETELRLLNNAQGDIASGAEDPFGIASDSGIAYSPQELQAIENAYAGIYDPAIESARNKVMQRQSEEKEAKEAEIAASKAETEFQNELTILGKKHGYDLDKMKADQGFQMSLASYKASLSASAAAAKAGSAASGMTPYSDERSFRTVQTIDELMGQVSNFTVGFGSLLAGVPTSQATSFRSQLNTLKASIAFGELTAMREASKTGGALGNVSNIELGLLESALAGLDTAQGVEDFKGQLAKAKGSINRWREAQGAAALGTGQATGGSRVLVSPTGESFDASDLTPEEFQEAIADGFRSQ